MFGHATAENSQMPNCNFFVTGFEFSDDSHCPVHFSLLSLWLVTVACLAFTKAQDAL